MSGMRLTILGCSGSLPGPDSAASGYLLRADGFAMALDLGNGTLGELQRHIDPFQLGALALTHLHADHCADVAGLLVYLRYHPSPPAPRPRLPVFGPSETATRLAAVYASSTSELDVDHSDVLDIRRLGAPVGIGPFELSSAPVAHASEAYALRLRHAGATLVYTGDSAPCGELTKLAAGADLLLCEATWTDDPHRPENLHMSGLQAGQLATEAGVDRLLLTHVPPWTEPSAVLAEARREFDGPVELVGAGRSYDL
jgi:ribonuclease BN (tRNA processing enzyme)